MRSSARSNGTDGRTDERTDRQTNKLGSKILFKALSPSGSGFVLFPSISNQQSRSYTGSKQVGTFFS